MLIERGYKIKNASTFVGDHYLLYERQRLAIIDQLHRQKILKSVRISCLKAILKEKEFI